jgi:hypothetical protein
MSIKAEIATVYRGGRRRYLTKSAAIKAEAVMLIKEKHPSEKDEYDSQGYKTYEGFHWTSIARSHVLLRRLMRLISRTMP